MSYTSVETFVPKMLGTVDAVQPMSNYRSVGALEKSKQASALELLVENSYVTVQISAKGDVRAGEIDADGRALSSESVSEMVKEVGLRTKSDGIETERFEHGSVNVQVTVVVLTT